MKYLKDTILWFKLRPSVVRITASKMALQIQRGVYPEEVLTEESSIDSKDFARGLTQMNKSLKQSYGFVISPMQFVRFSRVVQKKTRQLRQMDFVA